MATAICKPETVTLNEDLASEMKRKKDVEMDTEDLQEKLNMLRLKVQERDTRDARIESDTTALLSKSMSLDNELTVEMEGFSSMRERMTTLRNKNKVFHCNMIDKLRKMGKKYPEYEQGAGRGPDNAHRKETEEDDDEEIIYKPKFLGRLKGGS